MGSSYFDWRTSSYTGNGGGNCVEVGQADKPAILVRDTKDRNGGTLAFPTEAWSAFLVDIK